MESEQAAPTQSDTMWRTVTGSYMSEMCMDRDDYKQGSSLKGVATHECFLDTRIEITKVKYATAKNQAESEMTINYDEVYRNNLVITMCNKEKCVPE